MEELDIANKELYSTLGVSSDNIIRFELLLWDAVTDKAKRKHASILTRTKCPGGLNWF